MDLHRRGAQDQRREVRQEGAAGSARRGPARGRAAGGKRGLNRADLLTLLADRIAALPPRSAVAVDGVDCAGKTTLADELAGRCPRVLRASLDGFHRPRAERYARGRDSPQGCYEDTFDLDRVRTALLMPFSRGLPVRTAVWDVAADAPFEQVVVVPSDAVLVVDGVFLQRPELRGWWQLTVFLHVPDDVVVARARVRDPGDADEVERRYRARYLPAQELYVHASNPWQHADLVVDLTDPDVPAVRSAAEG